MKTILVGAGPDVVWPSDVLDYQVIAIDGGYEACLKRDIRPDYYLGDQDSYFGEIACPKALYDSHKDQSDMELALSLYAKDSEEIYITGALDGEISHTLANILLISKYATNNVAIYGKGRVIRPFVGPYEMKADLSEYQKFSLFALVDQIKGVSLTGFEYPLENASLSLGSSLGLSNVPLGTHQEVTISEGLGVIILEK